MILNIPAGADAGLITSAELRDAIDKTLPRPFAGAPGQRYVLAADLGISNDFTAIALLSTDAESRAVVALTETFRGTPAAPVDLQAVEDTIVDLARRFPLERCVLDQWQAQQMAQRLRRRGVPVQLVTMESSRMDRLITLLKGTFSKRLVRIPAPGAF